MLLDLSTILCLAKVRLGKSLQVLSGLPPLIYFRNSHPLIGWSSWKRYRSILLANQPESFYVQSVKKLMRRLIRDILSYDCLCFSSKVCEDLFIEVLNQREKDKEKSNVLLLLVVVSQIFHSWTYLTTIPCKGWFTRYDRCWCTRFIYKSLQSNCNNRGRIESRNGALKTQSHTPGRRNVYDNQNKKKEGEGVSSTLEEWGNRVMTSLTKFFD